MARETTVEVSGKAIVVKQLTVEQVDALLQGADATRKPTTAELLIDATIPIEAVVKSTGLTIEELNGPVDQDDLRAIWEAVEAVNPFLSPMMERLLAVARRLEAGISNGLSAG